MSDDAIILEAIRRDKPISARRAQALLAELAHLQTDLDGAYAALRELRGALDAERAHVAAAVRAAVAEERATCAATAQAWGQRTVDFTVKQFADQIAADIRARKEQ